MFVFSISGLGMALVHPSVTATIGEYFNKRRAMANGIAFSGASTGGLIFAPIMSSLFENYGYSGTLLIVAGMTLNICITGALLRPISWFERKNQKLDKSEDTENHNSTKPEKEFLVSNDSLVVSVKEMQSTDDILLHLMREGDLEKPGALVNRSVLQLRTNGLPKLVRSGSQEPETQNGSLSPLLAHSRAFSLENLRKRTISAGSEVSTHKTMSPMNSLVESLSRSKLALYASADCVCASVVDIRQIPEEDEGIPAKLSLCSKLKNTFDLTLFKNPVFPLFLVMAGMFAAFCLLTPSFLVPHAKDLGLTIEQRGLLLSIVAGCGLTSRLTCAIFADKKCVRLTSILAVAAMVMGIMAHSLRFFSGFGSMVVLAVMIGKLSSCANVVLLFTMF